MLVVERKLGADDLRSLFADLAEELSTRSVRGEVHLAGAGRIASISTPATGAPN